MSLMPEFPDGYYDKNGEWQRTKFCFVSCGAACTCMPPNGIHYRPELDDRKSYEGTSIGSDGGDQGGGQSGVSQPPNGVCLPMGATDQAPSGDQEIPGFCLAPDDATKLTEILTQYGPYQNGQTALYWHIVSLISAARSSDNGSSPRSES